MYARINTSRWNPETRDRALQLTSDTIIPAYAEQPGFKGYVLLLEPDGDKGIAITLWETEEQREASRSVAQAMTKELRGVLKEPPTTENLDVIAYFPDA
jgi:heme-degrading monooxygenase HmoA